MSVIGQLSTRVATHIVLLVLNFYNRHLTTEIAQILLFAAMKAVLRCCIQTTDATYASVVHGKCNYSGSKICIIKMKSHCFPHANSILPNCLYFSNYGFFAFPVTFGSSSIKNWAPPLGWSNAVPKVCGTFNEQDQIKTCFEKFVLDRFQF